MNTTSIPEFAAAELTYRRSRITSGRRTAPTTQPDHRRWHRSARSLHAA